MRNRIIILAVILIIGFAKVVKAEVNCVGHEKDQLVSLKEIYPWILITVREQEAAKIKQYRKPASVLKPQDDPNLLGGGIP